jgi:hypothetical protein
VLDDLSGTGLGPLATLLSGVRQGKIELVNNNLDSWIVARVQVVDDLVWSCSGSFVPPRDAGACQSTSSGPIARPRPH